MHLFDLARTIQADKDRAIEAAGQRRRLLERDPRPEPTTPPAVTARETAGSVRAAPAQCTVRGPVGPATR
jgi:hypothetical protein